MDVWKQLDPTTTYGSLDWISLSYWQIRIRTKPETRAALADRDQAAVDLEFPAVAIAKQWAVNIHWKMLH